MCGLCGIALADPAATPAEELLRAMASTLVHRGPDDEGIVVHGPLGLGFRRLSIIDLAGGHQPLWNETRDVAVCCNGEIYNFRELRADLEARGHVFRTGSDAETVVHLYEEHGPRLVEHLVGMFAFCVLDWRDAARPRVLLGRDRLGIKPLYVAECPAGLLWGSEAKAVLAGADSLRAMPGGAAGVAPLARRLPGVALLDYLVQGYVSGAESAWEGVRRLPPGHVLEWTAGAPARVTRYWDLPLDGPREPAPAAEILEWVDRVVADRLVADVPLGAFLSGGVDSTGVATSMAARLAEDGRRLVACSVGFREKSHDELDLARATAARLGAVHHTAVLDPDPTLALETLPWHFDEPLSDPSTVPTWLVSRMAREHVTVALSGDGGDEVFAGYRRHVFEVAEERARRRLGAPGRALCGLAGRAYPKLDWAPRFLRAKSTLQNLALDPARAYYASMTQLSRAEATALLAPELRAALEGHDPFAAYAELWRRPRAGDGLYRAQYADFHSFLPDRILAKTDRASMGVSLEVRVPLLDHRFVERFANLPTSEKVRGGRGKHALREALRARVPSEVLDGPKKGFDTPLAAWIRGPLHSAVADAVETLPARWFHRATLRARLAEHRAGARDHGLLLWTLLVLEHWRRRHGVEEVAA